MIIIRNTEDSPEEREALNPDCKERDRENGIDADGQTEKESDGD